jgi:hypothetical protein
MRFFRWNPAFLEDAMQLVVKLFGRSAIDGGAIPIHLPIPE